MANLLHVPDLAAARPPVAGGSTRVRWRRRRRDVVVAAARAAGGRVKQEEGKAGGRVIRVADPVREGRPVPPLFSVPVTPASESPSPSPAATKRRDEHEEEKRRYYLNMGYAIRTLREEIPNIFYKEPSFDIYRDDIVFRDPFNKFEGIDNYRTLFWGLRFTGRIFFKALWVDIVSIWQPAENLIMIRWIAHGIPRVPWEGHGRFDGASVYKLDKSGKIYEHKRVYARDGHRRRRCLHLLVEDWNRGFSLYKLDTDDFDPESNDYDDGDMDSRAQRLPRRPLVRLTGSPDQRFIAAGRKIFDFHLSSRKEDTNLVFDTGTLGVTAVPAFQAPKSFPEFWAVGHTVYVIDSNFEGQRRHCFEMLRRQPVPGHGEWRWEALPEPPFCPDYVMSRALHPDGSTIFISFNNAGTISFDAKRGSWKRHGRWMLPFDGEAHFVGALDAWVGLSSKRKGHIVMCQMPSTRPSGDGDGFDEWWEPKPRCKSGKDMVYCRYKWERHLRASLTYLGDAEFCLQETLTQKGYNFHMASGVKVPMLLRLVTFRVEHSGEDGELRAVNRRSRIYEPSRDSSNHTPVSFWI